MLRTKAMREKEEQREKRKYRFSIIRVRFPDGLVLQVGHNLVSFLYQLFLKSTELLRGGVIHWNKLLHSFVDL